VRRAVSSGIRRARKKKASPKIITADKNLTKGIKSMISSPRI